jgi:hypothetical protein
MYNREIHDEEVLRLQGILEAGKKVIYEQLPEGLREDQSVDLIKVAGQEQVVVRMNCFVSRDLGRMNLLRPGNSQTPDISMQFDWRESQDRHKWKVSDSTKFKPDGKATGHIQVSYQADIEDKGNKAKDWAKKVLNQPGSWQVTSRR